MRVLFSVRRRGSRLKCSEYIRFATLRFSVVLMFIYYDIIDVFFLSLRFAVNLQEYKVTMYH